MTRSPSPSPIPAEAALLLAFLLAGPGGCAAAVEGLPCAENYPDRDCDGVPDETDRCPGTPAGELHDAKGCTALQSASCVASPRFPEPSQEVDLDGRDLELRWDGTCDGYVVYVSPDPGFAPASTVVLSRLTTPRAVLPYATWKEHLAEVEGQPVHWQVRGGKEGREFVSEARTMVLRRGEGAP
ncbi:hypothetical protein L6R50_07655 [Myxococcota bacterium]|nr:hypothetical protein [Myxococcota bacterium]